MTRPRDTNLIDTPMTFTRRSWGELEEYRRTFPLREGRLMPVGVALDRLLWTHPELVAMREAHTAELIAKRGERE